MSRARLSQLVTEFTAYPEIGQLAFWMVRLVRQAWSDQDVVFPRVGSSTLRNAQRPAVELLAFRDLDFSGILDRGASSADDLEALAVLALLGGSAAWPAERESCKEFARCLLWHETSSALRCLTGCGAVLDGSRHRQLAESILDLLESGDLEPAALSTSEYLVGRAWLTACIVPECADLRQRALQLGEMPRVAPSVCARNQQSVEGELGPRPRSAIVTTLLAMSGILFVARILRLVARLVLLRRATTSLWLNESGLELFCRQEVLGRVVREQRVVVPIENICSVEREVKYPRIALYAGLLALTVGTLLGMRLFVDGLRVPGLSFSMVALGLGCMAVGVLLDLALSGTGDTMRGRCRLVVLTRGRSWNVGNLEPNSVDRLLTELLTRLASRSSV